MQLVKYDAMCTAIQACHSVDEVKNIRDQALALEAYASQAMNMEAERKACEIRLRAERKAGELLSQRERKQQSGLKRGPLVHAEPTESEYQQAKQSAGISDTQAKRWQKLASVDPDEFEQALQAKDKPSTTGIIRKINGSKGKMLDESLWLWGRLRDFEQKSISEINSAVLLGEMTDTMQADLIRIIPVMVDYLNELMEVMHDY